MSPIDYGTSTLPNVNDPGNLRNILTNNGTMKLKDFKNYEHAYIGQTIRIAQDY